MDWAKLVFDVLGNFPYLLLALLFIYSPVVILMVWVTNKSLRNQDAIKNKIGEISTEIKRVNNCAAKPHVVLHSSYFPQIFERLKKGEDHFEKISEDLIEIKTDSRLIREKIENQKMW